MRTLVWIVALLTVAVTVAVGLLLKLKYDAFTTEIAECRTERVELKKQLDSSSQKLADLSKQGERNKAELAELEELRRRTAETEKRVATFRQLRSRLQKMIDTGKLGVSVRKGRMLVKLPAEVLFAPGEAALSDSGQEALKEVAVVLREFPDRKFMVSGHTDNQPVVQADFKGNWELSTARAVNVTEFLIEQGVKPAHLVAAGYSEYDPVGNNGTKPGRADNRRIELELLPDFAELPKLLGETSSDKKRAAAP
jgi:chemotaxis protein MotB